MPSAGNNYNFPPDIVARFQEGYKSNPGAGMEAMRKTHVSRAQISPLREPCARLV